jgi:hypothetical protein
MRKKPGQDTNLGTIVHRRDKSRRKIEAGTFSFDDIAGHETASVAEVAALFRADPRTIRARITDGTIPATNLGEFRIPVRWIREQLQVGAA